MNIFIAGHNGMVGSAIRKKAQISNLYNKIVVANRKELDLMDKDQVVSFLNKNKIDYIFIAAAKVGGINANKKYPADFIYQNLTLQNNLIESAYRLGINKILFLGSSCIYPKFAKQPIQENQLLSGYLESSNKPYALSKISGIEMCSSYNLQYGTDYRCLMPTNLFGPGDNYDLNNCHVIPALIRKFVEAKNYNLEQVIVWGSGKPLREFLHVDDLADACIFVSKIDKKKYYKFINKEFPFINIGSGSEISIYNLSQKISQMVGFQGKIIFNKEMPDGTPRKLLDSSIVNNLGWSPKILLDNGLKSTINEFINHYDHYVNL